MKTTKHTLQLQALHGYETDVMLASAAGDGARKRMAAKVTLGMNGIDAVYVVTNHLRVVYEGPSLEMAIAAYNEAQSPSP